MNIGSCTGYEPRLGMGRRHFLQSFGMGLGSMALAHLQGPGQAQAAAVDRQRAHFAPRAKRVIFLFQSGGPAQMDLFDRSPLLNDEHGKELPEEIRSGQRLTTMTGSQSSFPLAGSPFRFEQHGESGAWFSELLPETAGVADELCIVKSMFTDAINHGPAVTYVQTGSQFPGRPSMGAWVHYGLGSANENLPTFVVLFTKDKGGQPLTSRAWGSAFLPSKYQGVRFRAGADPVLYLANPGGIDLDSRREMLNALNRLHEIQLEHNADPEVENRIAQYELAFRMQQSIPDVVDLASEPEYLLREYGDDVTNSGSFASNCLLARRLVERDVRFVQLYHPGWDHHASLPSALPNQCRETDRPAAALIRDLKRRGLLEDTLVIWGGEFGRTNYCQGKLTPGNFGRDHHPRCFTIWMAGGGVKGGQTYGETDPYSYNVIQDPVHIHDLQATILHLLGIDHERLTYKHQGRRYRLTDVHGKVVDGLLA